MMEDGTSIASARPSARGPQDITQAARGKKLQAPARGIAAKDTGGLHRQIYFRYPEVLAPADVLGRKLPTARYFRDSGTKLSEFDRDQPVYTFTATVTWLCTG